MNYMKCVSCRIRVSAAGASTAMTGGACPGCGKSLEPVRELIEVVGYRSPTMHDRSMPPTVSNNVTAILARRDARARAARLDAEHWLDESGAFSMAASQARGAEDSPTTFSPRTRED